MWGLEFEGLGFGPYGNEQTTARIESEHCSHAKDFRVTGSCSGESFDSSSLIVG